MLAMSDSLTRAVEKTFSTMLSLDLEVSNLRQSDPLPGEHIISEIPFVGRISGKVTQRLTLPQGRELGSKLLGITQGDLADDDAVLDIIGELSSIISGNFRSNLSDAGLSFRLHKQRIARASGPETEPGDFHLSQHFCFRGHGVQMFVDLSVNPWAAEAENEA
jgi:CheY-specific phosphatase CheX